MRKPWAVIFCVAGAILNIVINQLLKLSGIPLYLDTILTIAVTFNCGLFWGILCGALTNIVGHSIWFWGWEGYLFTLCSIASAVLTWLFIRFFSHELAIAAETREPDIPYGLKSSRLKMIMDSVIVLVLLSFAMCLVMSILGGTLTTMILGINSTLTGERGLSVILLSAQLFKGGLPVLLEEIFGRIPINIIDRFISVFCGYGIALLTSVFFRKKPSSI